MKIGIVGSRSLECNNIEIYIPKECSEIISGGAKGIDSCVANYAKAKNIKLTEILPEYKKYGRAAPLVRNKIIVESSDRLVVFWDGKSKGTKFVIDYAAKIKKTCIVINKS